MRGPFRHMGIIVALATMALLAPTLAALASTPGGDVRLTNDFPGGGYISAYTLATGNAYTDDVIDECSIARGRQNEPAVAVDPRNADVLLGSSNDYCGVYAGSTPGNFVAAGPIWLGYYRSEDGGGSFQSSLVPGYPGDTSPYAALAHIRTASAGDPVIAWDNHGRAYFGSESSGDPAGSPKTFGDQWVAVFDNPDGEGGDSINDGKRFVRSEIVARGSSAPNLLGKFHDKTAIEVDRTGGACDGYVYYSWSRFTGAAGQSNIYFSRSTDHGATWSSPMLLTSSTRNVQDPDISVTGNGHVYVTYDQGPGQNGQPSGNAIVKSTDCGQTFSKPKIVTTFIEWEQRDASAPEPVPVLSSPDDPDGEDEEAQGVPTSRDCGDFANHCNAGYTFFRLDSTTRSATDQLDTQHEWIYLVYSATKPGTEEDTGTTYGSVALGRGSQAGVYFVRYDGATGQTTTPTLIDNQTVGHQGYPDIAADDGILHALWWDTRDDACYSAKRPVGNCADRTTVPALDVYAARSDNGGGSWAISKVTDFKSNGNYEQFDNRSVPFGGDYLWITSRGEFAFGTWTDWRNTVQGTDPREVEEDEDNTTADVKQCRTFDAATGAWSGDQCPHDGGIDQDIYGDLMP